METLVCIHIEPFHLNKNDAFCLDRGGVGTFLQVIKVNNKTTILDSKQTTVKQQDNNFSSSTSNHSAETPANQVVLN